MFCPSKRKCTKSQAKSKTAYNHTKPHLRMRDNWCTQATILTYCFVCVRSGHGLMVKCMSKMSRITIYAHRRTRQYDLNMFITILTNGYES